MSTPTPTTLEAISNAKAELIRKALAGALFLGDMSAALPTSLTTGATSELAPLPTTGGTYNDVGMITKEDGVTWATEIETSEVMSWGYAEPTRRDTISETATMQFTAQETNLQTLSLYNNVDLSAVTPDATTGEVQFAKPIRPATRYYRAFAIAQDGEGADKIYVGRLLPRAMVSGRGDQVWSDGQVIGYQMTITATPDSSAGYSQKFFFGGPGWKALLDEMGFAA